MSCAYASEGHKHIFQLVTQKGTRHENWSTSDVVAVHVVLGRACIVSDDDLNEMDSHSLL